jgi:hypothetical protein
MAEHSLVPAYVEIDYHSTWSPHKMTIPTLAWNPGAGYGDFETHNGGSIAADEMVDALIAVLKAFVPASVAFDGYTVFTKATEASPSIPRAFKTSGVVGTAPLSWSKATQLTISAKTDNAGDARLVLMDAASGNDFDLITPATITASYTALFAEWFSPDNGLPYYFTQASITLNEKLRKQYHMT